MIKHWSDPDLKLRALTVYRNLQALAFGSTGNEVFIFPSDNLIVTSLTASRSSYDKAIPTLSEIKFILFTFKEEGIVNILDGNDYENPPKDKYIYKVRIGRKTYRVEKWSVKIVKPYFYEFEEKLLESNEKESGVISEEEFEEIKKQYNQPLASQEGYNKITGEKIKSAALSDNPNREDKIPPREVSSGNPELADRHDAQKEFNDNNQSADISESKPTISTKPSKRDIKKIISTAKKTCNLGKKEKELLTIFSDLEPCKTTDLTTKVPTRAYKKLKGSLQRKIKHLGLHIKTIKGSGLNPTSYYQLEYLPLITT